MIRRDFAWLVALMVMFAASIAARPASAAEWEKLGVRGTKPPPPPPPAVWKKLGERTVNGNVDRDTIQVGADDGTFTSIQIKVEGSTLRLYDMKVFFGDGSSYDVPTAQYYDKDTRS